MKHKQVLWVMICCLIIQVSSCLFGKCQDKKIVTKEKIVVNTNKYHEQTELVRRTEDQTFSKMNTIEKDKIFISDEQKKQQYTQLTDTTEVKQQLFYEDKTELVLKIDQDALIPNTVAQDIIIVLGNEEKIKKQSTLSEPIEAKKNFIHDGKSDLTEDQKYFVYAVVNPMVKQFCHTQTSVITHLIVAFLWHRNLPEQIIGTTPDQQPVKMCQLTSDDSWFVSQSGDNDISLWNVATKQLQWTVKTHNEYITQCILSSDDHYIISASYDGTLQIWTLLTGALMYTLEGHTDFVCSCSLSADNQFLLSTSNDDTMRMWSVTTGECINIFNGHSMGVLYAQFYANDRRIVSTCKDVRVWDVETNQCIHVLHGHTDIIIHFNLSSDEQYLLSGSRDKTARVWDLMAGTCKQTFDGHKGWIRAGCFVQKDTWIASIDDIDILCIWRISDAHCMYQFENYSSFFSLQHSYWLKCRNEECIIVSTWTKPYELHALSVGSSETICTIQNNDVEVITACVSSDGRYLFSGDEHGTIKMVRFSKK